MDNLYKDNTDNDVPLDVSSSSKGESGAIDTSGTESLSLGSEDSDSPPSCSSRSSAKPYPQGSRHTIGEVVATLQSEFPTLSVSKVRYLERRGLINLDRTEGGYRLFTQEDIDILRTALYLQENEYLPLEIIKQRINSGIIRSGTGQSVGDVETLAGHVPEIGSSKELEAYTKERLCGELDADPRFVEELISVGVIGHGDGRGRLSLDSRDLEIARIAIEMSGYGIQPRHLRGIVAAVEREVAMFKQVLNPELRSGDEQRISKAMESAKHLAAVDTRLKELIISGSVESFDPR